MTSWNRDRLLMELSPFSFKPLTAKRKQAFGEEFKRYQAFYGLDFSDELKGLRQSTGWFECGEYRIVLQCFMPKDAKATVFLFHGYFDHVGLYRHLIRFLVENGYAVVAYDMPGHGLSSGRPTSITSFSEYQEVIHTCLELCRGNLPEPFHCVGQSTGGAVLIDHLSGQNLDSFDKVVLLAPLVRPKDWTLVKGIHSVVEPFLNVWYRSFADNSNDAEFVRFLKEDDPLQAKWMAVDWIGALKKWVLGIEGLQPLKKKVLIVQGNDDQTVDWQHNIEVIKSLFTEVKIVYIDKGRHQLVNESAAMREHIFKAVLAELS